MRNLWPQKTNRMGVLAFWGLLLAAHPGRAQTFDADGKMTGGQKRQILTLVSDATSTGVLDSADGRISNRQLVTFGIYQVALHQMGLFERGRTEGETRLAAKYVARAVEKFWGKNVTPQSVDDWKYKNGYYNGYSELFEQLGVESIKKVRVSGVGKRYLTVYVDYVDSMASADSTKEVIVRVKMTLDKLTSKNVSRYILTSYKNLLPRP